MSTTLAWGTLGTGAIAKAFAKGLSQSTTGKLVAVGSRSQESADRFANEFNVPRRHASYEALLADPEVQAVYICTPHPLHAQWAIRAAEAGKHVLCEKPMTLNHWEAMAVVEAAHRNNVFLMEAFMYRCHPQTAKLIELIRSGVIGQVRLIQATFSFHAGFNADSRLYKNELAGGGILDVGGYTASMARLLAGAAVGKDFADPLEVKAVGHLGPTGVDEYTTASLRFPGNVLAQLSTGIALNQENVVRVFGANGRIVVPNPWVCNRQNPDTGKIIVHVQGEPQPRELVIDCPVTSFALEADVVGRAVAAGLKQAPAPAMSHADTLGNLRALDAWREQIGLTYHSEKPENYLHTVHHRPLAFASRNDSPKMLYGSLPGVAKPVSRLVMGVDNQVNIAHASIMFDDFFERGGNTFDTAYVYGGGRHERLLGQWVRNRNIREQVVILDKGAHTPMCFPDALTRQFEESLARMGLDYVDIYMMHRDNPDVPVGEFIDVMNQHLAAGRMRAFGVSNWSIDRIKKANAYAKRKNLAPIVAMSNNFSLARMVDPVWAGCIAASDPDTRKWLKKTQMPLMPWSSQARGFFTDRGTPDTSDMELKRCWFSDDNWQRRDRAIELAQKKNVLPIQIALAYVLCQPFPTFPLIGPRILSETASSFAALDIQLTPKELKWLNLEA